VHSSWCSFTRGIVAAKSFFTVNCWTDLNRSRAHSRINCPATVNQSIVLSDILLLLHMVESFSCFCCISETVFDDQSPLKFDTHWILWQQQSRWFSSFPFAIAVGKKILQLRWRPEFVRVRFRRKFVRRISPIFCGLSPPRLASEASSRNTAFR